MPKTAPRSLLPAACLSVLVGLAGCHVSFGSGSSSQSPDGVHGKPAHRSPSTPAPSSGRTSKPIPKKTASKPAAADPAPAPAPADKTSDGPHRDQPESNDPTRTQPTNDPKRVKATPKRVSPGTDDEARDEGGSSAGNLDRPGSVTTKKADGGGANEIERPSTLTAPK